ncbi:NAD(P)/FAD-dependent oxidoreductase [Georgenia yuyongxinii]|uniref:NAD(P)/FAD-dependent oxidoreductase n=1 Tax=Georgenia yuyongxinii TaxID=2589797 RepID=A0A552WKI0_9MICO|nr:NAD(P)/FAD-dependent oxidoreductase [Georgenia yuyongxinii]TRW43247.1 NAD(P)/FAD-dependent oxidoreductase [Georgenia yuyongxinii]
MASILRSLAVTTTAAALAGAGAYAAKTLAARSEENLRPVQSTRTPRILVAGGGYIGLYTATTLRKQLGRADAEIAVVDPRPYMTYQPFLPEAAAGSIEPRHVVTSLRRELRGATVITGNITEIRHAERKAVIKPLTDDPAYEVTYDHLVVGLGSIARTLPIPGLEENAIGFKHIEEATVLRNRVLNKLATAASTWDADERKRMLTFVFVGGGFAGIEAIGEVEDMARAATKEYDSIEPEDLRFVIVEGAGRILPELGEELGGYAIEQLRERGVEIHLNTFLNSCVDGKIELSDGTSFDADTIVWTAGVKPNPVLANTDLPLDERGRVRTDATLRVVNEDGSVVDGAWAAGDNAGVPDLTKGPGATTAPTAQHAVRQGKHLGKNLALVLRGEEPAEYRHEDIGTVASLGLYKGVAQIKGIKFRGPLAWFMHRSYHVLAMPSMERKVRILVDWTEALFFRRELVSLSALQNPRAAWEAAAASGKKPAPGPGDAAPALAGGKQPSGKQ